jgi:hypothetical protein
MYKICDFFWDFAKRKFPKQRRSRLQRGGSRKSRVTNILVFRFRPIGMCNRLSFILLVYKSFKVSGWFTKSQTDFLIWFLSNAMQRSPYCEVDKSQGKARNVHTYCKIVTILITRSYEIGCPAMLCLVLRSVSTRIPEYWLIHITSRSPLLVYHLLLIIDQAYFFASYVIWIV